MEKTRIIMTEVTSPYGKYTKFTIKGDRKIIAEVDRRDGKYLIFAGVAGEIGSRTNKTAALKLAQEHIRGFIPDAEFKFNAMSERVRLA